MKKLSEEDFDKIHEGYTQAFLTLTDLIQDFVTGPDKNIDDIEFLTTMQKKILDIDKYLLEAARERNLYSKKEKEN